MSIEADFVHAAAQILAARRLRGEAGPRLPEACRPHTLEQAMAIQAAVTRELDAGIGGWKCGLPTPERIVVAPIYAQTIQQASPCAIWPRGGQARVEPELAFVLGHDLPARALPYSHAEIDAAIGHTHLALELIASRYAEPAGISFAEALADGLVNQGLWLGPQVDTEAARLADEIALRVSDAVGVRSEHAGRHPNGLPRTPLYWLVDYLRSQGQDLKAGQAIITGSYAGVLELPLGEVLTVDYAGLGSLTVSFDAHLPLR